LLLCWYVLDILLKTYCVLNVPDDSYINCKAADARGWKVAHYLDPGMDSPPEQAAKHQIRSLQELRKTFPEVFKSS
jgi:pyrimidine and pyridine-specific 5'-nucleotidase